jgi:hypothetical protein
MLALERLCYREQLQKLREIQEAKEHFASLALSTAPLQIYPVNRLVEEELRLVEEELRLVEEELR